jgi:hypothetical protein
LSFVDDSGRSIDKNLISFGMTNLGMIQALLKNNVISEGSFIFFDEPENSPPISVFNSVANFEIISNGGLVDLVFKVSSKS